MVLQELQSVPQIILDLSKHAFTGGHFDMGHFDRRQFDRGQFDRGQFDTGQFDSGQLEWKPVSLTKVRSF